MIDKNEIKEGVIIAVVLGGLVSALVLIAAFIVSILT